MQSSALLQVRPLTLPQVPPVTPIDTFADDVAGASASPAPGVVTHISSRAVTDPADGVVADTAVIAVAGSDTNDGDRLGNNACGSIGAVATPTTIAAATRSTAAGWGRGGTMHRVPRIVK